jgi:hypothetical protein
MRRQIVRANRTKRAGIAAEGGADEVADEGFRHLKDSKEGRSSFLKKKNQKTFAPLRAVLKTPGTPGAKKFCRAFSKATA